MDPAGAGSGGASSSEEIAEFRGGSSPKNWRYHGIGCLPPTGLAEGSRFKVLQTKQSASGEV